MVKCTRCGKENPAEIHTCTPLALRLALALRDGSYLLSQERDGTADELERLFVELEGAVQRNRDDTALLRQALEALENHTAIKHPQQRHYRDAAIDALKERLK